MDYIIENKYLKVTVTDNGGTLKSIVKKDIGNEILWQGGEAWKSRDVAIFPLIGKCENGSYLYKNKEYRIQPHGIIRYSIMNLLYRLSDRVCFSYCQNEDNDSIYPFRYNYSIEYVLDNQTLNVI